jgi:hypothetical protein
VFLLASVLQADEYILIVFHDLAEDLEAVVEPDFLSDLTSLNLGKHFVVFGDVHALLYWSSLPTAIERLNDNDKGDANDYSNEGAEYLFHTHIV